MDYIQKGNVPIQQIIFVELDSVLGSVLTTLLKQRYGKVDILHHLRTDPKQTDVDLLLSTTNNVVSTCWSAERTFRVLSTYCDKRGWKKDEVRVYSLGKREFPRGYKMV